MMQNFGGVAKSFSELISTFHQYPELDIHPSVTFSRTNNEYLTDLKFLDFKPQRKFLTASGGLSTLMTLGPIRATSSLWAGGKVNQTPNDVLHATYYRPTWLERRTSRKLVVTIHDFIPELLGWTGVRNPHIGKKLMCQKADKIISVSQSTTELLLDLYGVSQDRVKTIHHGVKLKAFKDRKMEKKVPNTPSILYVGHRSGYKNFQILLKSVKLANSRGIIIRLVSAGPVLTNEEKKENSSLIESGLWEHFNSPNDELLGKLYVNATIHVVTSLMEGFGMTILESMSYGTPTILADIPVFREVAGNNALYFQANSEESLLSSIEQILDSSTYLYFASLSEEHAKSNSWELTAKAYADIYSEITERLEK